MISQRRERQRGWASTGRWPEPVAISLPPELESALFQHQPKRYPNSAAIDRHHSLSRSQGRPFILPERSTRLILNCQVFKKSERLRIQNPPKKVKGWKVDSRCKIGTLNAINAKVGSNSLHAPRGNPPFAKAQGFWQMPFSTPAKETNVIFKQKYLISAFGDLQQISLINRGLPRLVSLLRTRWSPSSTQSIKCDWRKKRFKNFELHPRRKSNYPRGRRWGVPVTPRPSVYHATDYSWGCHHDVTEPEPPPMFLSLTAPEGGPIWHMSFKNF